MRVPPVPHRTARCPGPSGTTAWRPLPQQGGAPAPAHGPVRPGTVAVTGTGSARAVPDLMHFGVCVEIVRDRAVDAMAAVGATADALVAAARSLGIAAQDIRGGEVRLECRDPLAQGTRSGPAHSYSDQARHGSGTGPGSAAGGLLGPAVVPGTGVAGSGPSAGPGTGAGVAPGRKSGGYRAAETFQMTVRRLETAGPTLEAIAEACGPQAKITGIAFGVSRPEDLRQAARRDAYADACARAGHYALLAGRRLGPVQSVDETPPTPLGPHPSAGVASASTSATATGCAPPSPGTSDTVYEQVSVHAVFLLL